MIRTDFFRQYLPGIFILILFAGTTSAQQSFRGNIVFRITYGGSHIDLAEQQQLPKAAEVSARDNRVRTQLQAGVLRQVKLSDSETRSLTTLLDIDGGQYAIETNPNQVDEMIRQFPEFEYVFTDEYENILGYSCQKVLAISRDSFGDEQIYEIFFTAQYDGYPLQFDLPYREIPGLMLRFQIRAGNLMMQYEAISVDKRNVSARTFRMPRGYQSTTLENLRELLSGDM